MKILNLIQCTNLGGMEQASLRLMRGLKDRGDNLQLLSLNPVGRLGPLLEEAGIPHEGLPYLGKGGWRSYGLLKDKLKNIHADGMLMTGHHLLASMALGDFCEGHRILTIHYHHGGVKSHLQWKLIYKMACRRFNAVTFNCDFIRKEAEAIYPPIARLAHTVRYQLDIPPLPAAEEKIQARKAFSLPLDRLIVGNAGWLIQRKRFDVFLRVARKVLDKNPDVIFAAAGSGEEEQNLKRLADELGIAASVRWLGWQQEMSNFHKSLDVLLFNSDWDAVGLTPLEAMSYGVPAVCSVVHGGLGEILDSNEVGFLLPSHDIGALAERILYLLKHPAEAAAIGLAGRKHLEIVCDPAPIVDWHAQALAGKVPSSVQSRKSDRSVLNNKKRTALLFHRVGPYHFARARAAGSVTNTRLIEVFKNDDVYGWDPVPGANGFERVTLFENNTQTSDKLISGVQRALETYQPDAITIPGWADAVAFTAIRWGGANRVPVIIMSETTEWDEPRVVWKEWIKRRILRMCSAGLVGGQPHAEYLSRLGMARERIFQGYDAVDNEYFARNASEVLSQKEEIRKKHGLPENYFLASARFVDKKNLLNLVRAYGQYRESAKKDGRKQSEIWHLVLLGDGPLKSEICNLVASLGLQQYVLMPGFKQYNELPEFYALAKVFIHASTVEQWGLVVNEAMASGLPVLVSNRCGCAQNMVQEGVNGYTFDPYDPKRMAEMMSRISSPGFPLSGFGSASSRIIAEWSPTRFASGLSQAIKAASDAPRVAMGAFDRLLLQLLSRK
jgi:glycosyltransferase involved in cell wall biosynthesis